MRVFAILMLSYLTLEAIRMDAAPSSIAKDSTENKTFVPYFSASCNIVSLFITRIDIGVEYHFTKKFSVRPAFTSGSGVRAFQVEEKSNCFIMEGRYYPFRKPKVYVGVYGLYRTGTYTEYALFSGEVSSIIDFSALDFGVMIGYNYNFKHFVFNPFVGYAYEHYIINKVVYEEFPGNITSISPDLLGPNQAFRLGINIGYKF